MTRLESVEAGFATETAEHVLTVVRDDGVYRHIACGKPGTMIYAWEIITWPGHLAITGDLGSYIFQRVDDMLRNFFSGNINPEYWLEKCTSHARPIRVVSVDSVRDQAECEMAELGEIGELTEQVKEAWSAAISIAVDADGTTNFDDLCDALQETGIDTADFCGEGFSAGALRALCAIKWARERYLDGCSLRTEALTSPTYV